MKKDVTIQTIQPLVEENILEHKYLHPVAFICNKNGAVIINMDEGLKDRSRLIEWLCSLVIQQNAHKIILAYDSGAAYNITEITHDNVKSLHKEYVIDEQDGHVEFKEEIFFKDTQPEVFIPIQKSLLQLQ